MASGGSAALPASGARSFDFGSDDVLCSYDDYTAQLDQSVNGKISDQSSKDLHENRVGRPLANIYGQPDDFSREDVLSAVDKCMKKYADNLIRNLEGISGRLTQLELYCFKLERSIGEFRADMIREQSDGDLKLASLEKHVHEVHRSVQIIRDKQELSETQKELTKLQLPQKDPTNSNLPPKNNEGLAPAPTTETKSHNDHSDASSNQQLALALPHQIPRNPDQMQQSAQPSLAMPPQDPYAPNQGSSYYTPRQLLPLEHQSSNLQPELLYAQQRGQMRDLSAQALPFTQYRTQWSQPMQPQQQSSQPPAPRPTNPPLYAHYSPNQPSNTIQNEAYSMAPPASYTAVLLPSGYGVSGNGISHHHPSAQHSMQRLPPPLSQDGQVSFKSGVFMGTSAYASPSTMQGYNAAYLMDGSRVSHPQSFRPGNYATSSGNGAAPMQISGSHPYGEMIEKAVSMGYPRDQVIDVVQGIGESGQPLELNALLDRLNALANGGARRPWSG